MAEPSSNRPKSSLFERMSSMLMRAPEDREQLLAMLRQSQDKGLLDAEAVSMIEGVLQVSELSARDIMVPRSRMDVIDISLSPSEFVPFAIRTGHSRFPVVDGERDNVVGILHAKDLLRLYAGSGASARELLRPAVFIPDSKRLNVLLRDFRLNRNHLALVVDEYGGVSGLVTIEDVLEQIVGNIEDEFDDIGSPEDIVAVASGRFGPRYRVQAQTDISRLNEVLGTRFDDAEHDTVGGMVTGLFGRVPRAGERIESQGVAFEVVRTDARTLQTVMVEQLSPAAGPPHHA